MNVDFWLARNFVILVQQTVPKLVAEIVVVEVGLHARVRRYGEYEEKFVTIMGGSHLTKT